MDQSDLKNSRVSHEESDANTWAISRFGIFLGLGLITILGLVWFMFEGFTKREQGRSPRLTPIQAERPRLPPEPRLQNDPRLDLRAVEAGEDAVLNGYGWVNPDQGIVRIPIDKAIDIIARKGSDRK